MARWQKQSAEKNTMNLEWCLPGDYYQDHKLNGCCSMQCQKRNVTVFVAVDVSSITQTNHVKGTLPVLQLDARKLVALQAYNNNNKWSDTKGALEKLPVSVHIGWHGSRVLSVLDSGTEGSGFKSQPRCCRVHTHHASVYQAAKLVAALLRVARVTAGLAESNGSLLPGLWLTSLQAECQELGSALVPYARQSSIGYLFYPYTC